VLCIFSVSVVQSALPLTLKGLVLRGLYVIIFQPRKTKPVLSTVIFSKAMAKMAKANKTK